MNHPLKFIPAPRRKALFWLFFALTLIILGVFQGLDARLKTRAAPAGIISFEFARNAHEASQIISSWGFPARLHAAFGLGLDYLFMPVYALALGLAILLNSRPAQAGAWQKLGNWLGWGVLLAAACDALENVGLYLALNGYGSNTSVAIVYALVNTKFALLLLGLLYSLIGLALTMREKAAR
ncbi:MAG: hypothetical protein Fur0035_11460 [Anaerolineales bacterium]